MNEVRFRVQGLPPAKNEAKSMLAEGHAHHPRVVALLEAAQAELSGTAGRPLFGRDPLGLAVTLMSPAPPPSDATNYLGGICDVLEAKDRRGAVPHLGSLASVALYDNDSQIREVHFTWEPDPSTGYEVRLWRRT